MKSLTGNKILIAEDSDDSRRMLRVFLESYGFEVVEAVNGKEAVEAAQREMPDLILMDLNMPELDGVTAAMVIRHILELKDVPIIANSAHGGRGIDLFLNIKNFGNAYIDYIAKPLNLDTLAEKIETVLLKMPKAA